MVCPNIVDMFLYFSRHKYGRYDMAIGIVQCNIMRSAILPKPPITGQETK